MVQKQWNFEGFSTSGKLAAGFTLLFTQVIGIIGNIFVLIIIMRILRHRKSIPNLLIFILTTIDLITLPLTYTQAIISHLGGDYIGGQTACDLHGTAITFCKYASVLVVSVISLDRFIAMFYPFCYRDHLLYDESRKYRLATLLFPLIVIFAILSILPLLGMGRNVLQYPGSYCLFDLANRTTASAILIGIHISFLSMFLVTAITTNIGVCMQAHRLIQKIKPSLRVSKRETQQLNECRKKCKENGKAFKRRKRLSPKQEKKLLKTSILATGIFLICWAPFLIRMFLAVSGVPFSEGLDFISARLVSLQSVLDPWLYPFTRRQYRLGFEYLSHRLLHILSFGLVKEPTTTLDEIIDARSQKREALRYYRERKQTQLSKIEEGIATEKFELTDTASHTKDTCSDYRTKGEPESSVTLNVAEENANINENVEEETIQ